MTVSLFYLVVSGCASIASSIATDAAASAISAYALDSDSNSTGNRQYDIAKQNDLNYHCVTKIYGNSNPPKDNAPIKLPIPFVSKKFEELKKQALQECDLHDFVENNYLDYECTEEVMFSPKTKIFESESSHALRQETKALKECKLNTVKDNGRVEEK